MGDEPRGRKLLWWNMPVSPDKEAEAGRRMMMTLVIWFGLILVGGIVIGIILAIA